MQNLPRIGLSRRAGLLLTAMACVVGLGAPSASAGRAAQDLTADTPPGQDAVEIEPQVAVVPGDAKRMAVAWNQLMLDGGWEVVAALSTDGGTTWTQSVVPGLDTCTSPTGDTGDAGLPSLSYGPDGRLYLSALCYVPSTTTNEQLVTTLPPGSASWSATTDLGAGTRGRVIADAKVPGSAYIAYLSGPGADTAHSVLVRHTVDGGRTWLPATTAYASTGDDAFTADIAITGHAARSGAARLLIALHGGLDPNPCCTFTLATRSDDNGVDWSPAERVPDAASDDDDVWPTDPEASLDPTDGSQPYGSAGQPIRVVAAADGNAYVVWSDLACSDATHVICAGTTQLFVSRTSPNGGWTRPVAINQLNPARAFEPQITATANGTVAVTYYDDRRDAPGDGSWTVDLWQAVSRDSGKTWQDSRIAGPMDIRPAVEQFAFTDYYGITSVGDDVITAYVATAGLTGAVGSTEGLTDVYLTRTHA